MQKEVKLRDRKLKIGILTTFNDLRPEFSLAAVVSQQLTALYKHGYEPVLFVLETFQDTEGRVPGGVEVRRVLPRLILEPYSKADLSNFDSDVKKATVAMEENMQDIDVCLTHDIIFINSYLPYNQAMRNAMDTKLSHIKWLHWMHSGPSIRPTMDGSPYDNLYTLPKNSRLVYMNYTDAIRAAEMYGIWPKDVRTIFNPMDIRDLYNFNDLTRRLADFYDLLSPEILIVYPLSTTRMGDAGKQLSKVIWIAGHMKSLGRSVKLIVPNAHANAQKEKDAIEEMYSFAYTCGLERRDLVFTSLFEAPSLEHGVSHEVVRDLFTLGNVFIFPSVSENCPLILLEAMAAKNILVLNYSFPAMRDFAAENALYFRFGSLVDSPQYPLGQDSYYKDVAKLTLSEFDNNAAIKAATRLRREFNVDYIFKRQLEPAILEMCYGR